MPPLGGQVRDSLLSQIRSAHASTVRATIRREGEWPNLDYGHHLGYGARRLTAIALKLEVERFKVIAGNMEKNPEYAEAKDLIQQAQRVLESAFEDLLRRVQHRGRTAFKDALKHDRSLWVQCEGEWGRGSGYRDRVADTKELWFNATAQQEVERELFELIDREWGVLLTRSLARSALIDLNTTCATTGAGQSRVAYADANTDPFRLPHITGQYVTLLIW